MLRKVIFKALLIISLGSAMTACVTERHDGGDSTPDLAPEKRPDFRERAYRVGRGFVRVRIPKQMPVICRNTFKAGKG